MNAETSILWRRLDQPGHEYARVERDESSWRLVGVALFAHETQPCRLEYVVTCDDAWATLNARVTGWVGDREIDISITADGTRSWRLNGASVDGVRGCTDVDLNFSPSTNLLPIKRFNLAIGQRAEVRAAWLRFPSFKLERLDQFYTRTGERTYRYESGGGLFTAQLSVDDFGLPTSYENLWTAER